MPAGIISAAILGTPIGQLSVLARGDALVGAGFTGDPGELHARLHRSLRALPLTAAELPWLVTPLGDYFDGDLVALDALPVYQPAAGSRERLWALMRAVPAGTTVSYTALAARAGIPRAPRTAGAACAANLIAPVVPCHRALRTDGSLGGVLLRAGTQAMAAAPRRRGTPGAAGPLALRGRLAVVPARRAAAPPGRAVSGDPGPGRRPGPVPASPDVL